MTDVTLREYIEQRIQWIRELLEERFKYLSEALKLQAKEYERRLQDLNHENARILASQSKSVTVEKYESEMKSLKEKVENLEKSRNIITGREKQASTVWAYVLAIGAMMVALASLIVNVVR